MNINDIGLKALSWIKIIKGDAVNLDNIKRGSSLAINHHEWTALLQKNVTSEGKVDYLGFVKDSTSLEKYLDNLSQNSPGSSWSEKEQIAYWINTYNAFTIKLIVDYYPVRSIKDISKGLTMIDSPWDIKFFKIGGVDFDLNTIEHEILRKKFNEPRIHFAINCASVSCPQLRSEAYNAEQLNTQLSEQANRFVNNLSKNIISNNNLQLSKLFDWFKSDFTKSQSLVNFLREHTSVNISENAAISYLDYNWNLNE